MSARRLERALQSAIDSGVLPAGAAPPEPEGRPWPVVLLTALGAWLAALPLLGAVGLMLGDWITRGAGPYLIGSLVLAGAVFALRQRTLPLFVEQLAVPGLLVGGGSLGFGLFRDLPSQAAAAILSLLAAGVAWNLCRPWLRVLLGAAAALLATLIFLPDAGRIEVAHFGLAWHVVLASWLAAVTVQRRLLNDGDRARAAAALESMAVGWLLAALAGLAWWSGLSFLVGASLGGGLAAEIGGGLGGRAASGWWMVLQCLSVLLAAAAALWLSSAWPKLRSVRWAGIALVLASLAWFMPALGAVLLALAVTGASGRWRLSAAAAVAAAWIVGSFYYQLQWPLATKALVLVGAAAALAALAWHGPRPPAFAGALSAARTAPSRARQAGIALTLLAVLATANLGIWQKESLIAHGRPVYLKLAPVDPRSLMQGDYMRLNFRIPGEVEEQLDGLLSAKRPRVVVRLDERGIASVLRLDDGRTLGSDELAFELTPKGGRWVFVSDAWFFREGEGDRWVPAEYGEFRVERDGRALLVGLVGADLAPL